MGKNYKILIVDDNVHIRRFLRRELSRPDYQILEAANHMQLFSMLDEEPGEVDLVVLDPYIPYLSGITMLKRLQKRRPDVPVILYTYMTECRNHPIIRKASAFVEKTSDTVELKKKIAEILQGHHAIGITT